MKSHATRGGSRAVYLQEGYSEGLVDWQKQYAFIEVRKKMDTPQHQAAVERPSEKALGYKNYMRGQISHYYRNSDLNVVVHNTLQISILAGAAIVPFLLNIPDVPKLIPTIISGLVAVAAALATYYKFGERGRIDRQTAQELQQEYNRYDTERGDYKGKGPKEALDLFLDQTEQILNNHHQRFPSAGVTKQDQNQ